MQADHLKKKNHIFVKHSKTLETTLKIIISPPPKFHKCCETQIHKNMISIKSSPLYFSSLSLKEKVTNLASISFTRFKHVFVKNKLSVKFYLKNTKTLS